MVLAVTSKEQMMVRSRQGTNSGVPLCCHGPRLSSTTIVSGSSDRCHVGGGRRARKRLCSYLLPFFVVVVLASSFVIQDVVSVSESTTTTNDNAGGVFSSDIQKLKQALGSLFGGGGSLDSSNSSSSFSKPTTNDTTIAVMNLDKLYDALQLLHITSFDDFITKFGYDKLPISHQRGIIFGMLTFGITVLSVIVLMLAGGTVGRLKEQAANGGKPIPPDAVKVRQRRPLLLQRLLYVRDWMVQRNYPKEGNQKYVNTDSLSTLARMLLNVAPPKGMQTSIDDSSTASATKKKTKKSSETKNPSTQLLQNDPTYQENYVHAYRRCQDVPGGPLLASYPEGRYECFARAYAGCGSYTTTAYRRSYARLYEAVTCRAEQTYKFYDQLWKDHPGDIIGRTVRLEPLNKERHLSDLFDITNGESLGLKDPSYDPNMVWGFLPCGPFRSIEDMAQCDELFAPKEGSASFAIIESLSSKLVGMIQLSDDDPSNLSIHLNYTIMKPSVRHSVVELEACFLLFDKLFALGYRRISTYIDQADAMQRKLPSKLCMTQEAIMHKHRIIKDSNSDSVVYGLLNSDWTATGGARDILFKKIHGELALKSDSYKERKEKTLEFQQATLKQQQENLDNALVKEFEEGGSSTTNGKTKKGKQN